MADQHPPVQGIVAILVQEDGQWQASSIYVQRLISHLVEADLQPWTPPAIPKGPLRRLQRRILHVDPPLSEQLRRGEAVASFSKLQIHRLPRIHALSWIPDLQHVALPEYFTRRERDYRDRAFARSQQVADLIVLPEQHLVDEFTRHYGTPKTRLRVFHPVADFSESEVPVAPERTRADLPDHFFLFPSQWWAHKDHETLLRALALARRRVPATALVLTGMTKDYRHPDHERRILDLIDSLDLHEQVHVLGEIPHLDALGLMREAIAVINTSRYEGFGMTVDEGRSLGVPLLLSRISAHTEKEELAADYFEPGDVDALASLLQDHWQDPRPHRLADALAKSRARHRKASAVLRELVMSQ